MNTRLTSVETQKRMLVISVAVVLLLSACIALYVVKSRQTSQSTPISPSGELLDFEDLVRSIIPGNSAKRIVRIYEESDGVDGELASVEPINDDGSKWAMRYDAKDHYIADGAGYKNLDGTITTIVHEYAHIEALNETQVDHGRYNLKDGELALKEGAAKKGSYIKRFSDLFWSEETKRIASSDTPPKEFKKHLYESLPGQDNIFFTEYAATNEVEDFAESFAMFVLHDEEEFSSETLRAKYRFFVTIEHFALLKQRIIRNIETSVK